ncbi:hypothetical protein [Methylocystis sp. B8]|uniref:hypothetical protein n=1 Tax=Methylocystis sp. B8 TaxID=544938 RepID=UPI0010FE7B36|nr:hypothetical protein [Methylocystis sp. B8]TLG73704.1 hypothetical protein FEV16_13115 [Methylocystis sp. B8]
MSNDNEGGVPARRHAHRIIPSPSHKFPIGVRVIQKFGAPKGTDSFHVTHHLPDSGAGLQYRMKRDRDGQERVSIESSLELVSLDHDLT